MYEIYEERLVTQDGAVPPVIRDQHYAKVYCDEGHVEVRLAPQDTNVIWMHVVGRPDDQIPVYAVDLAAALRDLRRLTGVPGDPETADMQERAAQVVERSCRVLEGDGNDPVRTTLAGDLRVTMLQLIDVAARPA